MHHSQKDHVNKLHDDEPPARQMNFTQNSIEALHRRILFGHVVKPKVLPWAGGTQSDAAVTDRDRPFTWAYRRSGSVCRRTNSRAGSKVTTTY